MKQTIKYSKARLVRRGWSEITDRRARKVLSTTLDRVGDNEYDMTVRAGAVRVKSL